MKNYKKRGAWLLSLLLLGMTVLSMASCTAWNWLWSREPSDSVDRDDLILGGNVPEDTDVIFEGAVSYTGEAHSGTDIYYIGQAGSPNRNRIIVIDPGHQIRFGQILQALALLLLGMDIFHHPENLG